MHEVEVAKDWIDYLVAIGGLASAIVAIVALVLAVKSAKEAAASARHAEGLLQIARKEQQARLAERAKKAELDFTLRPTVTHGPNGTAVCLLELSSTNIGERRADCAFFSVSIGEGGTVLVTDAAGNPKSTRSPTPQDTYDIQWGQERIQPIRAYEEQTIHVQTTRAAYFSVVVPASPGIYECLATMHYEGIVWSAVCNITRDQDGGIQFGVSDVEGPTSVA